jgi:hypothetical protein
LRSRRRGADASRERKAGNAEGVGEAARSVKMRRGVERGSMRRVARKAKEGSPMVRAEMKAVRRVMLRELAMRAGMRRGDSEISERKKSAMRGVRMMVGRIRSVQWEMIRMVMARERLEGWSMRRVRV